MENISKGEISITEFLASADESIKVRYRCQFLTGLNNKTKLTISSLLERKLILNFIFLGWVPQELVNSLSYVLEHMDLIRIG